MRVVAGTSVFVVVVVLVGKLVFAVAASAGRLVPAGKLVFALPAAAAFVDRFASTMAAFDGRLALEVAVFVGRLVFVVAVFVDSSPSHLHCPAAGSPLRRRCSWAG